MLPRDTHSDAFREQVRLLRLAQPHERIAAMCSLSEQVRSLSFRALSESMPLASDAERRAAWIRLVYGEALADRLGVPANVGAHGRVESRPAGVD